MAINLGTLADQIYEKNQEIAQANAGLKELEGQKRELENRLIGAMQEVGTDIVRGNSATVSISENKVPKIDDYDVFVSFVLRKKAVQLFQRRIAVTAFRELQDQLGGKPIPGTSEFTDVRLNVRKV